MNSQFSAGDLVIVQHATHYVEYNGAPAVVRDGLADRPALDLQSMEWRSTRSYNVEILVQPPLLVCCLPHQLRPLKGEPLDALPRETLTDA